jgi:hypothetical protein
MSGLWAEIREDLRSRARKALYDHSLHFRVGEPVEKQPALTCRRFATVLVVSSGPSTTTSDGFGCWIIRPTTGPTKLVIARTPGSALWVWVAVRAMVRVASARGVGLWLRDAEDGHDPARSGDLDLGDQRFDEGFALVVVARKDDFADVIGDLA